MSAGTIIVTGATGRLGRAVLAELGSRGVPAVRSASTPGALVFGSNGAVDPELLAGAAAVINCAGRVNGRIEEVGQANIEYARNVAAVARAAGVRRFVQVSSFSVFGRVERIDADAAVAPVSVYGRSKAAAERLLAELAGDGFETVCVRLPFMFSAENPALLRPLVQVMRRFRAYPQVKGAPAERSMMTYRGAARLLVNIADKGADAAVVAAADPELFRLDWLADRIRAVLGARVFSLSLPPGAARLVGLLAPGVADRIFRSNVLAREANVAPPQDHASVRLEIERYLKTLV